MSFRRQGVVVAMLAGVAALAAATAFVLLARFQTVPVRLPAGIEASRGPVSRVEVAPDLQPSGPAATAIRAIHRSYSERSCGDGAPAPG